DQQLPTLAHGFDDHLRGARDVPARLLEEAAFGVKAFVGHHANLLFKTLKRATDFSGRYGHNSLFHVFLHDKSKFLPPDADHVAGFDRGRFLDALSVHPNAITAPFVSDQKPVAFAPAFTMDFGVIAADAVAVEHDVVFDVSPDARQAAAQCVSQTAV